MTMIEYAIWGILTLCVIAMLVNPVCDILEDFFVYRRDGGYGRKRSVFMDAARAAGLTYRETMDQLFLRETMAKLRREASDAVRAEPELWMDKLDKAKQDAFNSVAAHDKGLLQTFGQMLTGLSYGHILYPDEAQMVDALMHGKSYYPGRPSPDQIASLNIVRPS